MKLVNRGKTQNAAAVDSTQRRGSLEYAMYSIGVVAFFVFFWVVSSGKMLETNFAEDSKSMNIRASTPKLHTESNTLETNFAQDGESTNDRSSTSKVQAESNQANTICSKVCTLRREKRNGYLLDNAELVWQATQAKTRLVEKLKIDYGEYFEPIFKYRPVKASTEVSMERLKRKLKIKVLSMQSALKKQDADFHGCDCSNGQAFRPTDVLEKLNTEDQDIILEGIQEGTHYETYTWATGGHSASAAHGNLYNETYTAYMTNDLMDVFGSIGIAFEGRSYAMGGTSSGTLVSMCWKEIFGTDVDFFSWDYGMTDGKEHYRMFHYVFRGAMSPSRPAFTTIHNGGRSSIGRTSAVEELEKNGLPLFQFSDAVKSEMRAKFPDSAGISSDAIQALPEYVRNYRCDTGFETGDPFCRTDKYSKWDCVKRRAQTSWHPGFKDHALDGHSLSLFLTEALIEALSELNEEAKAEGDGLLEDLIAKDIEEHTNFTNAALPGMYKKVVKLEEVRKEMESTNETGIDEALFTRGPSFCRTAVLPSQSRYNGLLGTNTSMVGKPSPVGKETYYLGQELKDAKKTASESNEIRLVYDKGERESQCQTTVKPDYKDIFFVNSLDGWVSMTFPNQAEKDFFRYDTSQYEGFIVFHFKVCAWGKCPKGYLTIEDYNEHWEMKVNGQRISKVISIQQDANIAMGENGFRIKPDENGQYTIEINVKTPDMHLEFAQFVVY